MMIYGEDGPLPLPRQVESRKKIMIIDSITYHVPGQHTSIIIHRWSYRYERKFSGTRKKTGVSIVSILVRNIFTITLWLTLSLVYMLGRRTPNLLCFVCYLFI